MPGAVMNPKERTSRRPRWWQVIAAVLVVVVFFAWVAQRLDWLFE
jgi:type VI protein secretion system component VasF